MQGASGCAQASGGGSQEQVVSPAGQGTSTLPAPSTKQPSGLQHPASAVQCCACGVQSCGTWQVPSKHCSTALQQPMVTEQLWPVEAQAPPAPQVPLVAPGGMSQARPAQQSPSRVQALLEGTQGARQVPASQMPEQQSDTTPQAPPLAWQVAVGGRHLKAWDAASSWQEVGAQQEGSSAPVQAAPLGVQAVAVAQRSTPSTPGTHGAPLQHWSRNWQVSPGWMQQRGSAPSQPVGQVPLIGPPKHRRMPFPSGLQTGFPLPPPSWQQFWEAFTSVEAPQMLPGGLQEPPLSQVCSTGSQATSCATGTWSLMLQQEAVPSQ